MIGLVEIAEEDFIDTFRQYIPKTEVDALKERTGEAAGEQPQEAEQSNVERTTREPDQEKTEAPPPPTPTATE
jgi:hypothetical protein